MVRKIKSQKLEISCRRAGVRGQVSGAGPGGRRRFLATTVLLSAFCFLFCSFCYPQAAPWQQTDASGDVLLTAPSITVTGLRDKGGQVFNVKAYGAKGDGASDDTPSFRAAIAALPAHGGTVLVPASTYVLHGNPFATPRTGVHLLLMQNTKFLISEPWVIGADGNSIACQGTPSGFPGEASTEVDGCIIEPTSSFHGEAVIMFTMPSNNHESDVGLSNLTIDMRKVSYQTVLELGSVSHANFDNVEFTNSDGTRIKIVRGPNITSNPRTNEHITFRDIKTFGYTNPPHYASETPSVLIDGYTGQINFYNCSIQTTATGQQVVPANSVGIIIEGNAANTRFFGGYLGGFQTGVIIRNKSGHAFSYDDGTPFAWSFLYTEIESYTTGYSISGARGAEARQGTIVFPTYANVTRGYTRDIYLGNYSSNNVIMSHLDTQTVSVPIMLDRLATNNTVFTDSPDTTVTDSGSSNLVFGHGHGQPVLWLNGAMVPALNTVPFSSSPAFNASLGNTQKIILSGNVTSSMLLHAQAGEHLDFIICQDSGGSHRFVWPTNVKGGMIIGSSASTCSAQSFIFDGSNAYALTTGVTYR
jgi:Pectate lyase superfamily protein